MIKANELRIGNRINVGKKNYVVTEIIRGFVRCSIAHRENILCELKEIKPIELKSEHLLGIENCIEFSSRYQKSYKIGNYILVANTFGEVSFLFFEEGDSCQRIKYIHQLQNLYFALTGEELTVKL